MNADFRRLWCYLIVVVGGLAAPAVGAHAQVAVVEEAMPAVQVVPAAPGMANPIGDFFNALLGTSPQPQPAGTTAPVPVIPAGPGVRTVFGEHLPLKPTAIEAGEIVLPTEPVRRLPLDEVDSIDMGNVLTASAVWVGQDNRDLAAVGGAAGASGVQDIHITINGLPANRVIRQIVVNATLSSAPSPSGESSATPYYGVWRLDPAMTPAWRLAVERIDGTTTAELYLEPRARDSLGGEFSIQITMDDGSSSSLAIKATTSTDSQLRTGAASGGPAAGDGPASVIVFGHHGEMLHGQLSDITDKALAFRTTWNEAATIPANEVRAIRFGAAMPGDASEQFAALRGAPPAEDTILAVGREGAVSRLAGAVDGLAGGKLKFTYEGQARTVSQGRLIAVVFAAQPPEPPSTDLYQVIQLTSGDQLRGSCTALSAETLQFKPMWGGELAVPALHVSRITCRNGKLAYLSDLTAARADEIAYFSRVMPHRADQALLGGPLRIKSQEYAKGLAVHSRSALTYALDGKYDVFKVVVGFDDSTAGQGNVICRILADGKEIFSQNPLKADAAPAAVEVSVEGALLLTLEIDFGDGEDINDRVIWADAKLLRDVPPPVVVPTAAAVPDAAVPDAAVPAPEAPPVASPAPANPPAPTIPE